MKKLLAMLLCIVMILSLLAGCGGGKEAEEPDDGKIRLKIGLLQNATVMDYEENAFTKWLEEQTGYELEFQMFASNAGDAKSQLAAMVSTGEELPDILWRMGLGDSVTREYGEQGYFLDLREFYEDRELSATFWERFENELSEQEQKDNLQRMTDVDTGAIYTVPRIEGSTIDVMDYQVWINQAWLDELSLEAPTDPDSLYDVLVAFKNRDSSCIPLIGAEDRLGADVVNWIVNMFIYCNDVRRFNVDENGQLSVPYVQDAYREALIYINKLVKEGLLSTMSWSIANDNDLKAISTPANGNAMAGIFVGHLTLHTSFGNKVLYDYVPLDCFGYALVNENLNSRGTYITYDCEHPEEAFKLLMTMFSEEGSIRMRYGEYGTNWEEADKGAKSALGNDAKIKVLQDPWTMTNNACWGAIDSTLLINAEGEATQFDEASMDEWTLFKSKIVAQMVDIYYARAQEKNPKVTCPALVYTLEEEERTEQIRSNCGQYINKSRSEFCTGTMNPNDDAQWQAYLDQLEQLGLQDWLDLAQTVYDRQLSEN